MRRGLGFLLLATLTSVNAYSSILRESPLKVDTILLTSQAERLLQVESIPEGGDDNVGREKDALRPLAAIEQNLYCYSSTTRPRCLTVLEFSDTTLYLTRSSFPDAEYLSYNDGFGKVIRPRLAELITGRTMDLKEIRLYYSNRIDRSESLWSLLYWPAYVGGAAFVEGAIAGPVNWGRFGLVSFGLWMATTGIIALSWDPTPTLTITRIRFQPGAADSSEIPEKEMTLLRKWEKPSDNSLGRSQWIYDHRPRTLPKIRK